jgi:predicted DNA-binding protein (MmcQ/YjbR family)
MVSAESIEKQLQGIGFNYRGWGRTEIRELRNIILPDEEIYECVNGIYDGGFALMVATDIRVLLIDKKPLNYLTVEDMRYELISEIDYNHRLLGAYIRISSGMKDLKFTSLNQPRLRKLINHVQFCMAETKKKESYHQEGQNQHLEQINQQLQSYLLAQYQQQQKLHEQLQEVKSGQELVSSLQQPEPIRPSPELADYLFAQSLLAQHQTRTNQTVQPATELVPEKVGPAGDQLADLYSEGLQEVFGKHHQENPAGGNNNGVPAHLAATVLTRAHRSLEINPLQVAYSKLPMALRNRKFGRPSFHAHSQNPTPASAPSET